MTDVCAFCGELVASRRRMEGFTGWESGDGEIVDREIVLVTHLECYMQATPEQRIARLEAPADDAT